MKLFQAALHRKRIVVTTLLDRWSVEDCVLSASSWTMAAFVAKNLPVSLK